MTQRYGVAIFKGQRIRSVEPAPFTSVDGIQWATPDGAFSTWQLRIMDPATDIVYAPRRTALVPFVSIGSSLAGVDLIAVGSFASDDGGEE